MTRTYIISHEQLALLAVCGQKLCSDTPPDSLELVTMSLMMYTVLQQVRNAEVRVENLFPEGNATVN